MNRDILRVSATLLIISSILLSACGGGSSKSNKEPPKTAETPLPVTVSAEVQGLIGSGLAISLNGESITIPGSGTFAFPTQLQPGTELELEVTFQPEFPNFACKPQKNVGTAGLEPITLTVNCSYFQEAAHEHANREPLYFDATESGDIIIILRDEFFGLSIDRRSAGENWQGAQRFYNGGTIDMPNQSKVDTESLYLLDVPEVSSDEIYLPIIETRTTSKRIKYLRQTSTTNWAEFTVAEVDRNTYPKAARSGNRIAFFHGENGNLIGHTGNISQPLSRIDLGPMYSAIWSGHYSKEEANLPIAVLSNSLNSTGSKTHINVLLADGSVNSKAFNGRSNSYVIHKVLSNQRQLFIWSRALNDRTETVYAVINADGTIGDEQMLTAGYLGTHSRSLSAKTLAIRVNDFSTSNYKIILWSESEGFSSSMEDSDLGYASLDENDQGEIVVAFWGNQYLKIIPFQWGSGWGEDNILYNFDNLSTLSAYNSTQGKVVCSSEECSVFYAVNETINHYKLINTDLTKEESIGTFISPTKGAGFLRLSVNQEDDYLLSWSAQPEDESTDELSVSFSHYSAHSKQWSPQQDLASGPGLYFAPYSVALGNGFTLYWHNINPWISPILANTLYADILTAE